MNQKRNNHNRRYQQQQQRVTKRAYSSKDDIVGQLRRSADDDDNMIGDKDVFIKEEMDIQSCGGEYNEEDNTIRVCAFCSHMSRGDSNTSSQVKLTNRRLVKRQKPAKPPDDRKRKRLKDTMMNVGGDDDRGGLMRTQVMGTTDVGRIPSMSTNNNPSQQRTHHQIAHSSPTRTRPSNEIRARMISTVAPSRSRIITRSMTRNMKARR
uniref:Uncharacterized protein n=1 Tax=Rhodnius prolixus TaxID=13249 RepID=T1HRX4_RHOPR